MNRTRIALALVVVLATGIAHAASGDVSKVNGSITVGANEQAGQLDTVNGSITIGANARTGEVETVNGSIRAADHVATGGLSTVNGSIRVEHDGRIDGGLETVNGSIFVDHRGNVRGDVETVNGSIGLVDSDVGGGIATVNGDVTVGLGSHVRGGLHFEKPSKPWISFGKPRIPRVVIGPDARVDGPLVFEREVQLYVHATAKTGPITGATAIRFDTPTPPEQPGQ